MQDPAWNNGDYPRDGGPRVGPGDRADDGAHHLPQRRVDGPEVRPPGSQEQRHGDAAAFDIQFEVESYLRYQGQSFINRFDANYYLYITRALDQFDLAQAYGSLERPSPRSRPSRWSSASPATGFSRPSRTGRSCSRSSARGKRASYAELPTDLGHDSFLLESEQLYALVRGFLEREQDVFDFAI